MYCHAYCFSEYFFVCLFGGFVWCGFLFVCFLYWFLGFFCFVLDFCFSDAFVEVT